MQWRQWETAWITGSGVIISTSVWKSAAREGADLETRHQEKMQLLLANPYGADGYVVVVSFAARRVIFSLHRHD